MRFQFGRWIHWRFRYLRSTFIYSLIAGLTALTLIFISPGWTETFYKISVPISSAELATVSEAQPDAEALLQQGKDFYEMGRYQDAIDRLQQANKAYQVTGDKLRQALVLSNLALTYQQLGLWTEAETALQTSLSLLQAIDAIGKDQVLAQVLNIQGRFYLAQGQAEAAQTAWQQSAQLFAAIGDDWGTVEAQLNQAKALQALGLYRRSIDLLNQITQTLAEQPVSLPQAIAFRSLAEALMMSGDLSQARQLFNQSLQVAQQFHSTDAAVAVSAVYLGLGNLTRAEAIANLNLAGLTPTEAMTQLNATEPQTDNFVQAAMQRRLQAIAQTFYQQTQTALDWYQQAFQSPAIQTRMQAQLKYFSLLVTTQRWDLAKSHYAEIQTQLDAQPLSRSGVYNQIEWAESLQTLWQNTGFPDAQTIAQPLATAQQQARLLQDDRALSYALGSIGSLYKAKQQWPDAKQLTQQALMASQTANANDIAYRWQWQLGQILEAQGDRQGAIQAYQETVNILQSLRRDLVAINRDVQFSFREQVEPVYRELVSLLLAPDQATETDLEKLVQARNVIEGLQIAELDNFFREACLDTQFQLDRVVDQAHLSAAIFYTILLSDRLEVIVKLPQQPLSHYSARVDQPIIERTIETLLTEIKSPIVTRPFKQASQQIYDWLIRPAETALQQSQIETLVFVLDGSLRNVPIAALYDGQHYLLEKYSVALAPGLQLPDPKPLQRHNMQALLAGLSEARDEFPALTNVTKEVTEIEADIPSHVLLNQTFTVNNFQQAIDADTFPIVHIATHGKFSSNAAETFILAWDQRLDVNQLSTVLQTKETTTSEPIELLVLSACQTAAGDRRATLGLAGVAVRAGARSTIASLWNLDDDSGALLMSHFYDAFVNAPISKAEALRQAQQALLADPQYAAPRFWAPYVLLGNWL